MRAPNLQTDWAASLAAGGLAALSVLTSAPCWAQSPSRAGPSQIASTLPSVAVDETLDLRRFDLWPVDAAAAQAAQVPSLTVFTPQYGQQTGAAVIIAPGGGYISLASNLEGRQVADWFASRGVTAFVLRYRFGGEHPLPEPIEDGERAVRFVRAHATELGIDADRIGMIGFSAGGHLAAMTTAYSDAGQADAADPVEHASSRPDFLVLGYPSIDTTAIPANGVSRYCRFARVARWACRSEDYVAIKPYPQITQTAPPTFIYHTTNDAIVPVQDSLRLYEALAGAKVDVEMHLFAKGAHGSGLGAGDRSLSLWTEALAAWLDARGYLSRRPQDRTP